MRHNNPHLRPSSYRSPYVFHAYHFSDLARGHNCSDGVCIRYYLAETADEFSGEW